MCLPVNPLKWFFDRRVQRVTQAVWPEPLFGVTSDGCALLVQRGKVIRDHRDCRPDGHIRKLIFEKVSQRNAPYRGAPPVNYTPARVPSEPSFIPGHAVKTILGIDNPQTLSRITKISAQSINGDDGFCMDVASLSRIIRTRFPSRKDALAEWLATQRAYAQDYNAKISRRVAELTEQNIRDFRLDPEKADSWARLAVAREMEEQYDI
jgi:hypothetical protein